MSRTIHANELHQKLWTGDEICDALSECDVLQTPHWSWPLNSNVRLANSGTDWLFRAATQFVRLCGNTISIRLADRVTMELHLSDLARYIPGADTMNVVVNYSPMNKAAAPLVAFGPEFWREVNAYTEGLAWLAEQGIKVVAILLDHEHYTDDGTLALDRKLDAFYEPARCMFPDAVVNYYNAHGVHRAAVPKGWEVFPRFTAGGMTLSDMASCSLYYPQREYQMLETLRKTIKRTDSIAGITNVPTQLRTKIMPCVSLASTWVDLAKYDGQDEESTDDDQTEGRVWVNGVDYNRLISWNMGGLLNHPWYAKQGERYFDNSRIGGVWFWPEAFDPMMSLEWAIHFHAYCRGAMGSRVEL